MSFLAYSQRELIPPPNLSELWPTWEDSGGSSFAELTITLINLKLEPAVSSTYQQTDMLV